NITLNELNKIRLFLEDDENFEFVDIKTYSNLDILMFRLHRHIRIKDTELAFREIDKDEDIVHFNKIKISKDRYDSIVEKIEEIKEQQANRKDVDEVLADLTAGIITQEQASNYLRANNDIITEMSEGGL